MKTTKNITKAFFTLTVAASLTFASSCKKDATTATTVTEADAVELTTDAIVPSNAGLALQVNSSVSVYKSISLPCGVTKDTTITKASVSGAIPSYNYSLMWAYTLSCSTNVLTFSATGSSSYAGVNMTSTDKSTAAFTLSGILPTITTYTLNANYNRTGTATSKIARTNTFNSSLTIQSSNIVVDKTSLQILSGTASVVITGASTAGNSFSFNGNITFLGGNKATLVLNSGVAYSIQWV